MPEIKTSLFRRARALQVQIDDYLDKIAEAGLAYEQGLLHYMTHGPDEQCEEKMRQISHLESEGDRLQRTIETTLVTQMLIPDTRGDVLGLLDDLDHILDVFKARFLTLMIEHPEFPEEMHDGIRELVSAAVKAVESTVLASRAYFRDPASVRDHIHKISFYESEADRISIRLRKQIFDGDFPLDRKMYMRDGLKAVDQLADDAQDVGDRLAIYAAKRAL